MRTNSWFKLATVALTGLVLSFVLLWGIQEFNQYKYYNGYNSTGTMQMNGYGNMNMNQNGINIQGNMNMQGSSNMQGGMGMGMDMMNMGMDNMMMKGMMGGM